MPGARFFGTPSAKGSINLFLIFFTHSVFCCFFVLFIALAFRCLGMLNQAGQSAVRYQSAQVGAEMSKQRRASSLEMILSPMVESTLQRK